MQRNKERGQDRQIPKWKIKAENVTEKKTCHYYVFKKNNRGRWEVSEKNCHKRFNVIKNIWFYANQKKQQKDKEKLDQYKIEDNILYLSYENTTKEETSNVGDFAVLCMFAYERNQLRTIQEVPS